MVQAGYYDEAGNLAGTAVQEYAAPAGERAVIDYLEGTWEGEEYIPVSLTLQATPLQTAIPPPRRSLLSPTAFAAGKGCTMCCWRAWNGGRPARPPGFCENEALQAMVSGAARAGPKPAAHSLRVAVGGSLCA